MPLSPSFLHTHIRDKKAYSILCGSRQACADDDYWNLCGSQGRQGRPRASKDGPKPQEPQAALLLLSTPSLHPSLSPFPRQWYSQHCLAVLVL